MMNERASVPAKKAKTTYYQRKDEIRALYEEIEVLEDAISHRQEDPGWVIPSIEELKNTRRLDNSMVQHEQQQREVNASHEFMAGTQSAMSSYYESLSYETACPLRVYTHLPSTDPERGDVINSMRAKRLQTATSFMDERNRFMNLRVPHEHQENFEYPSGDKVTTMYSITLFQRGHSLRQVFDALKFFMKHYEMALTEELGILTVRESESDHEDVEGMQTHFMTSIPGLPIETNCITYAQCIDEPDATRRYAVASIDYIDQDDRNPYQPQTRARQDLTGAVLMEEVLTPQGPIVVVTEWMHVHLRMPTDVVASKLDSDMLDLSMSWSKHVPRFLRDRLSLTPPAGNPHLLCPC